MRGRFLFFELPLSPSVRPALAIQDPVFRVFRTTWFCLLGLGLFLLVGVRVAGGGRDIGGACVGNLGRCQPLVGQIADTGKRPAGCLSIRRAARRPTGGAPPTLSSVSV